jgi:DNA polymerase IV
MPFLSKINFEDRILSENGNGKNGALPKNPLQPPGLHPNVDFPVLLLFLRVLRAFVVKRCSEDVVWMSHRILHLDMDAFFASVEVLDHPELKGKPVVVGGKGPRSVVAAASYEVRKFGVRSAMPMCRALERCPHVVVVQPHFDRYHEVSENVFELLRKVTPLVEQTSIDEGYLDISEVVQTDEDARGLGARLKTQVWEHCKLKCSVGIAPCKFAAKIASDLKKPDALVVVRDEELDTFLLPLDVGRIPGVGKEGLKKLNQSGIKTIADLRRESRSTLTAWFGRWGERLHDFARGIDPRQVVTEHERKSLGTERTFDTDVRDVELLREYLGKHAVRLARELDERALCAATVTVKVRYANFDLITRRRTFQRCLFEAAEIASAACDLLEFTEAHQRAVRLVGVSLSGLRGRNMEQELPLVF